MEDCTRRETFKALAALGALGLGATASLAADKKVKVVMPRIAVGSTTPGEGWQRYPAEGEQTGIYIEVDTSEAGFKSPPIYLTALLGGEKTCHWVVTGVNSIYHRLDKDEKQMSLESGFRIYLKYPGDAESVKQLEDARTTWSLNWVAIGE